MKKRKVTDTRSSASAPALPQDASAPPAEDNALLQLSAMDAERVLAALENPPAPNAAALRAAKLFRQGHE